MLADHALAVFKTLGPEIPGVAAGARRRTDGTLPPSSVSPWYRRTYRWNSGPLLKAAPAVKMSW